MSAVVYQFRDSAGVLLYVGMSGNLGKRLDSHTSHRQWMAQVANIGVEHFSTRALAAQREAELIRSQAPAYNVQLMRRPSRVAKVGGRPRGMTASPLAGSLLAASGFTARAFASHSGISESRLSEILSGRGRASTELAMKLADALGVPVGAIFPEAAGWLAPTAVAA